jgi:hypothetical protein
MGVEEVHPDEVALAVDKGGQLGHGEARGVGGDDALLLHDAVDLPQQILLERDVLRGRLDHDVAALEILECGRALDPAQDPIGLVLGQLLLAHQAPERLAHALEALLQRLRAAVLEDHLAADLRGQLGDPRAHGPGSHDADGLHG